METNFDLAQALTMTQAAKLIRGRGGRRPHIDVIRRWCNPLKGCMVGERRAVLRSVRVGGEILTMPQWIEEFQQARVLVYDPRRIPITDKKRAQSVARALARLDAEGI